MNPFLGSADGIIYNPWCRSSPAPLSRLAGEVDALSAELMMTFSLPIFPGPPVSSTVQLGMFLLPPANQNVAAVDYGEAPAGGGMLYRAPLGA